MRQNRLDDKLQKKKRIAFIEMMGVPGSYDASVYDHFDEKDQEGLWFIRHYRHVPGISITTHNICIGESLPLPSAVDGLVLAGTYNSVHDNTDWQKTVREWLPKMRAQKIPILAICGSHQLLAHIDGSEVVPVDRGPFAGTFPLQLTEAGKSSPLMHTIPDQSCFHYANSEHVVEVPYGSTLLGSSSKVPVAALDFGNHCYSTQFHPEATDETLGTIWQHSAPELRQNYNAQDQGNQLVENFLLIVCDR
jgi:GMP synthase-like glutamine amidotransferase